MLSLRSHAIICASLFGALIGIAIGGNILQATGVIHDVGAFRLPLLIVIFTLFIAFGFSAIPVMVKLVLGSQRRIGNEDLPAVRAASRAESIIIWAIWALMAAGVAVALPAAIQGGLFTDAASPGSDMTSPHASAGTLVARPGMTLSEVLEQSSLHIDPATQTSWTGSVTGGQEFDFRIPDRGITLRHCRYYFLGTYVHDPQRIESINVGTSPSALSRAEVDAADAALRNRLAADGWFAGREEYRTDEDRSLHGGAMRGPEGRLWLKSGIVLDIGTRRMDDPAPGEDVANAGRWIQFVELWLRNDYPGIERYSFETPRR